MRYLPGLLLAALPILGARQFDVVVVGGTPGGVAAAVSAARAGRSVALVEYHNHLGGMSASGLGKSDIENRGAIGGLFREFVGRVYRHYVTRYGAGSTNARLSKDGYYYEPSVAERIFDEMAAGEPGVTVLKYHRLDEAFRHGKRVVAVRVTNRTSGEAVELRGKVFIDATYEGDLAAYAGARYRLGRESRAEFNELHAGVVYQDYETRTFITGTTGEADQRVQAYTFRLCLSTDPANSRVLTDPPPGYDRGDYLLYIDDWKAGRMGPPKVMKEGVGYFAPTFDTVVRALSIAEIPNGKTDVNMNPRPLGFPFAEINQDYTESGWEVREKITARIRNLTIGLLYFLQNDQAVPAGQRALARRYHLAKDEFAGNDNFPWQLYVREARRIRGLYTLSESDVIVGPEGGRTRLHKDSIAAGEFPLDSFPVRKYQKGHDVALEGYLFMLDNMTRPYQIPYRIMVPEEVDGLLVPVAASTTHVAFSTIRLEPTWMALGQAAGRAAHIAIETGKQPRAIDIDRLQRELLHDGQVLTYFRDIDRSDRAYAALQYFGTKGFFGGYEARSGDPVTQKQASEWLRLSGVSARDVPGDWDSDQPLSRSDAKRVVPGVETGGGVTVTRGEFCRALYESAGRLPARQ